MNKTAKIYGVIFLLVLAVLAVLEATKKDITDWRKNFSTEEKTPFGLFVFKNEARQLFGNQLKTYEKQPFLYYKDQVKPPHNILILEKEIDASSWHKVEKQVQAGSDVFLSSDTYLPEFLTDTLQVDMDNKYFEGGSTVGLTDKKFTTDRIILDKFPSDLVFKGISSRAEILGTVSIKDQKSANFIKINFGKGHFYLHSEPLVFTNYYLLKPGNERYVQDVLSYLPKRETVWFGEDSEAMADNGSPLSFVLSKPGLRYAWWLFLASLLLFVIFNAKRRQRIVPIINPLQNKSADFVKSIGNLYLQEGDFHDMMAKKAQYFLHRVRIDLLIDTNQTNEYFVRQLQLKTGAPKEKIDEAMALMKKATDRYAAVTQQDLARMNRLLDEILK